MSDSGDEAFQSADEGDTQGPPSVDSSAPGASASGGGQAGKAKPAAQSKKKDRKRGKRGKKGAKSPRTSETVEPETVETETPEAEEVESEIQKLSVDDRSDAPSDVVSAAKQSIESNDNDNNKEGLAEESSTPANEGDTKSEDVKTEAANAVDSSRIDQKTAEQKSDTPPREPEEIGDIPRDVAEDKNDTPKQEQKSDAPAEQKSDTPKEASRAFDRLTESTSSGGGWGWGGGWGSSLLSTATSSVSTLTSNIGEGIKTAVETVESSLGVPDPEELARIQYERRKEREADRAAEREAERRQQDSEVTSQDIERDTDTSEEKQGEKESTETKPKEQSSGGGWLSGWGVSGISSVVHKTAEVVNKVGDSSKTLVTGSLDVLETIGKKTYEAVAEGEHGVKKLGRGEKTNLSSLLKEAAEEAEKKSKQEEQFVEARKSHFGAQFDDNQGVVQLEALEMLSNECEAQVHNLLMGLSPSALPEAKALVIAIKEAFNIDLEEEEEDEEEQDFTGLMKESAGELGLDVTGDKLITVKAKAMEWLAEEGAEGKSNAATIHQEAIQVLARLTAAAVGHFHRVGQLSLADKSSPAISYKSRAVSLANTTKYLGVEVGILSGKFNNCLSTCAIDKDDSSAVNPLMTNIYLEATNSSSYIQDAFQLLLPVLQQAALQSHKSTSGSPS